MSDDLRPLYREMAAGGGSFRGLSILQHRKQIAKLARRADARTMLDYGCGAGDAYSSPHKLHRDFLLARQDVTLYDPSFSKHNKPPRGKFDLVVCSDVLEHIPADQVDEFVRTLFSHTGKVLWASVCCRPAKKCFPGTEVNLHVTLQPYQWWHDTLTEHAAGIEFHLVETP